MVRHVDRSPAHFAEPEKWIAAIWGEKHKKWRGHFTAKQEKGVSGLSLRLCHLGGPLWVGRGYELAGVSVRGGEVLAAVWLTGLLFLYFESRVGHGRWDRLQGAAGPGLGAWHRHGNRRPWGEPAACCAPSGVCLVLWSFNIHYPLWMTFLGYSCTLAFAQCPMEERLPPFPFPCHSLPWHARSGPLMGNGCLYCRKYSKTEEKWGCW